MFMKKIYFALYIGFFAGIIWGFVRWMFYFFEFTKVSPAFLIEPFFRKEFMHSWIGHLSGIGAFILLSIVASILYAIILHKKKSPWLGIAYGMVWWVFIYVLIGPSIGMLPAVWSLDLNSILSDACVFTLWGVFIGYSIALEFTDVRNYEPQMG
ncbi:MAG: YqhR family membrane protein [Paenibacillaceae bacterium]